jgi:hypothetical protein
MSSAKRRINSTGRKKIQQDKIDLRLMPTVHGEPVRAKLSLDLQGLELPASASVVVEAYHRSTAMQFDCGTAAAIQIPPILTLSEIDQAGAALFRVKVVEANGKILASAERLRARSDAEETGRKSIFPVRYQQLGQEIWKVDIDDDAGPVLLLNSAIPAIMHRIHENPLLSGAVLAPAFRIVLENLALDPAQDADEEDTGWKSEWLKFCATELGVTDDPAELSDEEEREAWVNAVVRKFSVSKSFVERAKHLLGEHPHA